MIHGLNNQFLYSAFKLTVLFMDKTSGKEKDIVGTGFFVKVEEKFIFVTNRHNLDLGYKDVKYKNFDIVSLNLTGRLSGDVLLTFGIRLGMDNILFHKDDRNDIAGIVSPILEIVGTSNIVLDYFVPQILIADREYIDSDLSVCDFVAFTGYPIWHDSVEHRPIFRSGTISSDPRSQYHFESGQSKVAGDCVAYEAFSSGGSSGSPVFALQKGIPPGPGIKFEAFREAKLVGINGGHLKSVEFAHSGMSYFFKSFLIFDLV